jgi:hypothetical protein
MVNLSYTWQPESVLEGGENLAGLKLELESVLEGGENLAGLDVVYLTIPFKLVIRTLLLF